MDDLITRLQAWPGQDGRYNADCPFCGKEAKQGSVHFSFWLDGWRNLEAKYHCFVCGAHGPLGVLYQKIMCQEWQGQTIKNDIKLEVKPDWLDHVNDYQTMYASRADRVNLWQQYKAVTEEQITAYGLGVGRFPAYTSACSHDRLTVPITHPDAGIVGFRGRAFQCDCKRWLTPKGSRMFLFNWEALEQVKGQPLFIVENPIDALLLKARKNTIAVATLGVTIWKAEYTELIKTANPSKIVVAFDNDRPGNGAGEVGKRKWIAEHGRDIMPNGLRLVNHLLAQGLPYVYLFDWGKAAYGMDIGKLLA